MAIATILFVEIINKKNKWSIFWFSIGTIALGLIIPIILLMLEFEFGSFKTINELELQLLYSEHSIIYRFEPSIGGVPPYIEAIKYYLFNIIYINISNISGIVIGFLLRTFVRRKFRTK